jgi:hypothetical protein
VFIHTDKRIQRLLLAAVPNKMPGFHADKIEMLLSISNSDAVRLPVIPDTHTQFTQPGWRQRP